MLECFFHGLVSFLSARTLRSLFMRMRVVRGSMMSSTKPAPKIINVNDVIISSLFGGGGGGGRGGDVKSWSFISGLWGKEGGWGRITSNARKSTIC